MDTQIRGLVRRFGPTAVLENLNLDIPAGAFIALLGRSGSGKTTLLRTLAGLDTAEQGSVILPPQRAVVFQEPRLMPWKRVWENVALGLPPDGARERAEQAVVLQRGQIGLHLRIDLPRPRRHGDPRFAALRAELLNALGLTAEEAA